MSIENIFSNKTHKDVNDIIEKSKSPFFLYDIDSLKKKLRDVTEMNPSFLKLWYACKANPISSILNAVIDSDIGIDVASKGELRQVLKSTTDGSKIICTGPAKSKEYQQTRRRVEYQHSWEHPELSTFWSGIIIERGLN